MDSNDRLNSAQFHAIIVLINIITTFVGVLLAVLVGCIYMHRRKGNQIINILLLQIYTVHILGIKDSESRTSEDKINCKNMTAYYGKLDTAFDRNAMSIQIATKLKPIDISTTHFGLYFVTHKCLMEKFARNYCRNYQPTEGFGHYEFDMSMDKLDPSWDVILMDEVL